MIRKLLPLSALVLLAPAAAAPTPAPELRLIHTESRIEIDATGKVVGVEVLTELPPEIKSFIADNVRKKRFEPPMLDGRAVGGVTYAWQDACAAPVDGKYRLAVKYRGNGPALDRKHFPFYPREAQKRNVQSKWKLEYAISADGSGSIVDLQRADGGDGGRMDKEFRGAITQWIHGMKFQPERLDGKPVETRMQTYVDFVLDTSGWKQRAEQTKLSNDACPLALDAGDDDTSRDIALNSPFKPIAAN